MVTEYQGGEQGSRVMGKARAVCLLGAVSHSFVRVALPDFLGAFGRLHTGPQRAKGLDARVGLCGARRGSG